MLILGFKVLQSKDLQVSMTLHKPIINPIVQIGGKRQLRCDTDTCTLTLKKFKPISGEVCYSHFIPVTS